METSACFPPDPDYRDPITEAIKREIDRTLLQENLKLTPQQRLEKGQAAMRFALSLRAAGRRAEDKLFPSGSRVQGSGYWPSI